MLTKKLHDAVTDVLMKHVGSFNVTPAGINCGNCMNWAYLMKHYLPDAILCSNSRHHAFIKYQGKFYDSEAPEGVEDHMKLPCHINYPCSNRLTLHVDEEDFCRHWKSIQSEPLHDWFKQVDERMNA